MTKKSTSTLPPVLFRTLLPSPVLHTPATSQRAITTYIYDRTDTYCSVQPSKSIRHQSTISSKNPLHNVVYNTVPHISSTPFQLYMTIIWFSPFLWHKLTTRATLLRMDVPLFSPFFPYAFFFFFYHLFAYKPKEDARRQHKFHHFPLAHTRYCMLDTKKKKKRSTKTHKK